MTDPMPQMFNHCVAVYKAMDATGKPMEGKSSRRIWEGFLTKLINDDCGLAVPYYSGVRNNLMRMGCIEQINRGGGTHPSTWELIREPTEDLFLSRGRVKSNSKAAVMQGQINDLNDRVKRLEAMLQNIA